MSELRAVLPHPDAAACRDAVDRYARAAKDAGDPRPIGMLRAGAMGDLLLRPWQQRPSVTAHLTVVAPLTALTPAGFLAAGSPVPAAFAGSEPPATAPDAPAPVVEVDGEPITAAHLRELLAQLDAAGVRAPAGGSLELAVTDATGTLLALTTPGEAARLARRGCTAHPDTAARPDAAAHPDTPDAPGRACGCPVLGVPGPVDRYRPSAAQQRFLTARDRTCRHPGCTAPAARADLDHVIPHAHGGETSCDNLCCLCRRHHRLKTFAPGWTHTTSDDGVLTVITPTGVTRISRPPGYRVLTGPPAPPPEPDEDPPPF
ncbi:HNH endonuclease signature motif containing protein, partial [Blastococcus xanthinilyticus]|uniref:HNH endonuclease n=1 Tax=Blastococcus xanthinilyticus TaxID=1564164 RepID=A0A5S5CKP7_9ACTN